MEALAKRKQRRLHHGFCLPATIAWLWPIVCLAVSLCSGGCSFFRARTNQLVQFPQVLPPSPSLEQVIQAVNSNSRQIHNFYTDQARITGPDFPTLRASLAFERPMRLRLRAGTTLSGPELDLGSNDEVLWMWIRREPVMYWCRHDQLSETALAQLLPITPRQLVEALGVVELPPEMPHQGPIPLAGNRLQINSVLDLPGGPYHKVTIIQAGTALVLAQYLYDSQGQLIASAVAEQHRRDPLSGLVMPRVVHIRCPAAQLVMTIDLGNVRINRPLPQPGQLFAMPHYEGWQLVNLADPAIQPATAPTVGRSPKNTLLGRLFGNSLVR